MADVGFETQRNVMLAKYKANGGDFRARTRPYKSTLQMIGRVPDSEKFPTGGGNATMGHCVFDKAQELEFFGYGIGDFIPWAQGTRKALEDDTNVASARHTTGNEDFIIEGVSSSCRSLRAQYPDDTYDGTEKAVVAAYVGQTVIYDPAALMAPPQLMSPFNLESTIWSLLQPLMSFEFQWDETDTIKIGTMDEVPEGGAKSFLRASGDPRNDNRYRIPEGYIWHHQGDTGSDFIARAVLREAAVMPVTFVALEGADDVTVGLTLQYLYADIECRLHGLGLSYPSGN